MDDAIAVQAVFLMESLEKQRMRMRDLLGAFQEHDSHRWMEHPFLGSLRVRGQFLLHMEDKYLRPILACCGAPGPALSPELADLERAWSKFFEALDTERRGQVVTEGDFHELIARFEQRMACMETLAWNALDPPMDSGDGRRCKG